MSSLLRTVSAKVCSPWNPVGAYTEVAGLSRGGGAEAIKSLTLKLCQLSSGSPSRVLTAEVRVLLHWGRSTHSAASIDTCHPVALVLLLKQ